MNDETSDKVHELEPYNRMKNVKWILYQFRRIANFCIYLLFYKCHLNFLHSQLLDGHEGSKEQKGK